MPSVTYCYARASTDVCCEPLQSGQGAGLATYRYTFRPSPIVSQQPWPRNRPLLHQFALGRLSPQLAFESRALVDAALQLFTNTKF
jgi:hypothetical protein